MFTGAGSRSERSQSLVRARWAAVGAALAVAVAGGGLVTSWASSGSPAASSFVPVTPCRLMDTRPGGQGPRDAPIVGGTVYSAAVYGSNGDCVIPNTATAVSLNVTFVNPSVDGWVSVFPPDKPWPGTSNLNFRAGQSPTPNAVTSALSASGSVGFLAESGTVDLIADVVGYYEPATSGPQGPAGPAGATGPAGTALAYGYVEDLGTSVNVVPEKSKGLDTSMVTRVATGVYCFELESLWPVHVVSATAESSYGSVEDSDKTASAQVLHDDDFGLGCPSTSDMVVVTRDLSDGAVVNWFFYVTLN